MFSNIKVASFDALTAQQQRLFEGYFSQGLFKNHMTAEELWNASAEAANQGVENPSGLLEQSQLTTFIGVTSMWESTKTIDFIESVEEIRLLTARNGYRLLGKFKPGGGKHIEKRWSRGGKWKGEYKVGRREPGFFGIRGQFTMTKDLARFNSDVDYHPALQFWYHLRKENSDIRPNHKFHGHLKNHVKRYGKVYGTPEKFPIQEF